VSRCELAGREADHDPELDRCDQRADRHLAEREDGEEHPNDGQQPINQIFSGPAVYVVFN
jgi:hypothetical protein